MGDNHSATRRPSTQWGYVVEKVGGIQQYIVMVLTGQAHILQHVEQTGNVLHETRAEVQQLKAMYKELLEMIVAECNKPVDEVCSPMQSHKDIRRRSPDTDSRGGATKAPRGTLFPEQPEPQESVEQPESPKSPMMMVADLKKMISDEGPSSSTMPVAEVQAPMSTISTIMKNSPGGKRLLADWIKVLEIEESHDANYYYKKQE
jgi:hypothetical protein